jgi:hypothetical protein
MGIQLSEAREDERIRHSSFAIFRQRLYQIIAGYEDANDALRSETRKPEPANLNRRLRLSTSQSRSASALLWSGLDNRVQNIGHRRIRDQRLDIRLLIIRRLSPRIPSRRSLRAVLHHSVSVESAPSERGVDPALHGVQDRHLCPDSAKCTDRCVWAMRPDPVSRFSLRSFSSALLMMCSSSSGTSGLSRAGVTGARVRIASFRTRAV